MSSSIGEDSVYEPEGKLLIHIAENGHSLELECDGTTLVDSVMRFVASVSGIHINDQLVLCLDMKLEPQRPLSAYKLPCDDREVFIFNKLRIQANSPPPPPEEVTVLEITDPPLPSPSSDPHPLDDAPDPALKALPSYERQFRYHFQCGNSIYSRTQATYDNCERLLVELKVQERAVEVARSNLEQYYRMINQNYTEFMKRYLQQNRLHSDLLANFIRDMDRLRSVRIHPALQTGTRKCLLDFFKEEDLRRAADNCGSSHRQFENKVSQFKQMFGEVKQKVEELFASKASLPVRNLDRAIKEHQRFLNEQRSVMQSLSKDVDTVKKLVDDCLSHQVSSSLRPHDAVSALGPMYDVHDKNHLPKMLSCDQTIGKLLDFCKDKKNEMNIFIHSYVQRITYLSYIIKDVKLQFPVFREAMMRQDDLFVDLKVVRGVGPAYRACLAEVARRKSSMKLYMGMAGQLAEKLATKREAEVRRREEFLKTQSSYLPKDVLASMGLFDMPNQCDVNIAPFDTELLDINVSDIDRFAPEFACKGDRHGSLKNSVSMSHESEVFPEDDLLDGSELVEIAGTSRTEVENAKLRADLASAIAQICLLRQELEYESLDDSNRDIVLKDAAEKTTQALHEKDEYVKHLESIVKKLKSQCNSYEERIQDLEQKLSDQYSQEQKLSSIKNASESATKAEQTESMDEVSCISNSLNSKLAMIPKAREGGDENMMDSSGLVQPQLDSSMVEMHHASKDKGQQLGISSTNSSTSESMNEALNNVLSSGTGERTNLPSKVETDLVLELQSSLEERSNQLNELEGKFKAAMEEQATLKREVEARQKLLDESQMNCAHLENCLHEAREEAQTNLCAAERRAQEYGSLRTSAVKMRGLFERLRTCVYSPGGVAGFADSLRSLAQSLSNSLNEKDDDGTVEFRKCIVVLADKVGFLSRHRQEILQKFPELEAANERMKKELEEKEELANTLYKKLQLEKQANKEKISFGRLEVHERAAFVLNPSGQYEAINRSCPNYYLSLESIALFTDNLPTRPAYIVGQIVHIERRISTRDPDPDWSTPYNVPVGLEFFIVTVAMLPDTAIHSSSSLLLSS